MKKVVRLTENDLVKIVKRVINEQSPMVDKSWSIILSGLKQFNNPKVINFTSKDKRITSLNWGTHSEQGRTKNWGLSLSSDNDLVFQTTDENQSNVFQQVTGLKPNDLSNRYLYSGKMNFNNPNEVVSKVQKIIKSLG